MEYLGRPVLREISFSNNIDPSGDRFGNFYAAQTWAKQAGFSFGNTCCNLPTALMAGDFVWIAKWKNLEKSERDAVDAVCVEWDIRNTYKIFVFKWPENRSDTDERSVATTAKSE